MKIFLLLMVFAWATFLGGAGTQSDSTAMQGMGFATIVFALIFLFIIFKLFWFTFTFVPKMLFLCGAIIFIAYSMGFFNDGKISSLISSDSTQSVNNQSESYDQFSESVKKKSPNTEENLVDEINGTFSNTKKGDFIDKLHELLQGENTGGADINPDEYPEIYGKPRVITGSILRFGRSYVKLYGIDAPDPDQTCADKNGNSYRCGQKSLIWLQDWLGDKDVVCNAWLSGSDNHKVGVCYADDQDLAAAIVRAGWAVAYTQSTDEYLEYEKSARRNMRGLWNGQFYRPEDWRKIKNRKVTVTVTRNKPSVMESAGSFWSIFE